MENSIKILAEGFENVETNYVRSAALFSDELSKSAGRIENDVRNYMRLLELGAKVRGKRVSYFNIAVIAIVVPEETNTEITVLPDALNQKEQA